MTVDTGSMPETRLRELLQELHQELEADSPLDDAEKTLLRDARLEIEQALASDAQPDATPNARLRIEKAIEHFEDRHPDATMLLHRVLDALGKIGV